MEKERHNKKYKRNCFELHNSLILSQVLSKLVPS